jgi:hypothetical protein
LMSSDLVKFSTTGGGSAAVVGRPGFKNSILT